MSGLLSRFSSDAVKFNGMVLAGLIIVWLAVVSCAISSVCSRPWNRRQRFFWILWIVCLPGLGVLSYLPFSVQTLGPVVSFSRKAKKNT